MPGIGVVLNPHSKRYRKNPEKLKRMGFIVGDKGHFGATKDLNDIKRVAQEFKDRDIDILALSGGDGTNHVTLTNFINVYGDKPMPKIAFLRGGTLNTIAFSCGIFGSPEKILANLLYKYHEDEPFETTEIDIMKVNDHYGFIWGMGVIFNFMDAYYKGGIPSPSQAALTFVRAVSSAAVNGTFACHMFERTDAQVTTDGKVWTFKNYSALSAGSIPYLGLGFKVFRFAEQTRKFHAFGFSLPPRNVLRHVPLLFLGRPNNCPDWIDEPATHMTIKLAEPRGYTIDGDMHAATDTFDISLGPRLTVIVK